MADSSQSSVRNYGAVNADVGHDSDSVFEQPASAEPGDEDKKMFSSRRDKLVFLCLAMNNLFVSICFATMAPFFPTVAAGKSPYRHSHPTAAPSTAAGATTPDLDEATSTLIGMVFSVATFTDFLFSPLVGKELPNVGPKLVFLIGCSLVSGVTILFAFVDMISNWTVFLGLCYALRAVQGIGTACMFTASFTILAGAFPKSVGMVTGSLEVFSGLGFMVGPAIGGGLYASGGFKLPFLVTGSALAISTTLVGFVLPRAAPRVKQERVSLSTILSQPRTWLIMPTALLCACALGFLDPGLGPYLAEEFRLVPSKIGLVFLIGAGIYAVLAPLVGFIGDKWTTRPLIPAGVLLSGISYQLLGPSPVLPWKPKLWRTLFGLALMGVGIAFGLVPTSPDMLVTMREAGYKDSLELHSALGGVMGAAFSLGEGLGPSVGGLMAGAVGFGAAASVFGALLMGFSVVITLGTLLGVFRKKLSSSARQDAADLEESTALLSKGREERTGKPPPALHRSLSQTRAINVDLSLLPSPPSIRRAKSLGGSLH